MTGILARHVGQAADRPVTALEYRPMECSPKNEEGSPLCEYPTFQGIDVMSPCPIDRAPCHRTDGCDCGDRAARWEKWELAVWLAATAALVAGLEIVRLM